MTINVRVVDGNEDAIGVLLVLGLIGGGLYYLYTLIAGYHSLPFPYNVCLAFYYLTIVWPIESIFSIYHSVNHFRVTPYPNINFILAIALSGLYVVFLLGILCVILKRLRMGIVLIVFFFPAVIALGWLAISSCIGWLFAT